MAILSFDREKIRAFFGPRLSESVLHFTDPFIKKLNIPRPLVSSMKELLHRKGFREIGYEKFKEVWKQYQEDKNINLAEAFGVASRHNETLKVFMDTLFSEKNRERIAQGMQEKFPQKDIKDITLADIMQLMVAT